MLIYLSKNNYRFCIRTSYDCKGFIIHLTGKIDTCVWKNKIICESDTLLSFAYSINSILRKDAPLYWIASKVVV